jgi:hypothetical protein
MKWFASRSDHCISGESCPFRIEYEAWWSPKAFLKDLNKIPIFAVARVKPQ